MRTRAKQTKGVVLQPASTKLPEETKVIVQRIAEMERRTFGNTLRILIEDSPKFRAAAQESVAA